MKRYPGVSPFEASQKNIFFGRDKDIDKLSKMIALRKQVLLYAKSGIGKTSLLNAGVLPKLEERFTIIKVRFTAYNDKNKDITRPTKRIIEELKNSIANFNELPNTIIDEITDKENVVQSLWYYFKQVELNYKNKFILVFDQFEELFSYPEQMLEEFKEQLYELLHIDTPDSIMKMLAQKPEMEDDERIDELYESIDVNTVFAIRSDRLSKLNILSDKLPDIQKTFYELKPLDNKQVEQAITKPAINTQSGDYDTKPFDFEPQAIDEIIKVLSKDGNKSIETTQLQIVCQKIEDIAQNSYKEQLNDDIVRIKNADLPEFSDIFLNFYNDSIDKTCQNEAEKSKARIFVEDQLIRTGQRISLDEIICVDYLDKQILKKLVNTHLLRAERNSIDGFSYELSHDTLIDPILISRKKRIEAERARQEKERQEEELRKARQKAEQERLKREKERKQQRKIITIVSTAAVISIAFAIFGFIMWMNADKQTQLAKESQKKAEDALLKVKHGISREAVLLTKNNDYEKAKAKWQYLRDTIMQGKTTKALEERIKKCDQRIIEQKSYDSLLQTAENMKQKGEAYWHSAIENYEKAKKLKFDSLHCQIRINSLKDTINNKIELYRSKLKIYSKDKSPIGKRMVNKYRSKLNKLKNKGV